MGKINFKKDNSLVRHGLSDTRIYRIWSVMKQRTGNPKCYQFPYYGRRGISVCNEWKNSFMIFIYKVKRYL